MSRPIEKSASESPSTSEEAWENGPCATMDKATFVDRVARRAGLRYGQGFTIARLDDLIGSALIPEGQRVGNDGNRPRYAYGSAQYRRALQIVRLNHLGIIRRDQVRLMLFVRGYGLKACAVREALEREYVSTSRRLNAQVRSTYADKSGTIPNKHKSSLLTQMGTLDRTLAAGGLNFHSDAIVSLLRAARQGEVGAVAVPRINVEFFANPLAANSPLVSFSRNFFAGLLNTDDPGHKGKASIGTVEYLVRNSANKDLENARHLHTIFVRLGLSVGAFLCSLGPFAEMPGLALKKIAISIRDDPKWVALILVLALRILQSDDAIENMLSRAQKILPNGVSK